MNSNKSRYFPGKSSIHTLQMLNIKTAPIGQTHRVIYTDSFSFMQCKNSTAKITQPEKACRIQNPRKAYYTVPGPGRYRN